MSSKFLISKAFKYAYILFELAGSWLCNIIRHLRITVAVKLQAVLIKELGIVL